MKRYIGGVLVCLALAIPAAAQMATSGQAPAQQTAPQPPPPLSTWLKNYYTGSRNYLARAAEKMAEENYGMRPGSQQEVRTFGQILGHVINGNYGYCSRAKGEANPNQGKDAEKLATKAEIVKALNDALAYCDAVFNAQTDASLMETVTNTAPNGRQTQAIRLTFLISDVAHNNEHYGNLVTYFRIKGIVPPSSEPRN